MSPRFALLGLLSLLSACTDGGTIPANAPPLHIVAEADRFTAGRSFPLTVVRTWRKDAGPSDWIEEDLAPLVVEHLGTSRREDERRVEETRRYRAFAFEPGRVRVATGPGESLVLEIERSVDPRDPGPAELPSGPLSPGAPWWPWAAGAVLAGAVGLFVHRRFRRPSSAPEAPAAVSPSASEPSPREAALDRLARLRDLRPAGREEVLAYHREAAAVLRDYLGDVGNFRTSTMTSEQLTDLAGRPALAEILRPCDLVKFARHETSAADRAAMLDAAETFLREAE